MEMIYRGPVYLDICRRLETICQLYFPGVMSLEVAPVLRLDHCSDLYHCHPPRTTDAFLYLSPSHKTYDDINVSKAVHYWDRQAIKTTYCMMFHMMEIKLVLLSAGILKMSLI